VSVPPVKPRPLVGRISLSTNWRSRAPADNGAIPLAYTLRDTIADAEQAVGVYVAYRPQRLIFENAADHPTQLVESAAMASVALPAPSYVPSFLPK
jgi:hypothetical protein